MWDWHVDGLAQHPRSSASVFAGTAVRRLRVDLWRSRISVSTCSRSWTTLVGASVLLRLIARRDGLDVARRPLPGPRQAPRPALQLRSSVPASTWAKCAAAVRANGTTEVVADTVIGRRLTPAFAARQLDVAARLRGMLVSIDPRGYTGGCEVLERTDLRGDLARHLRFTLVVGGAEHEATPPEQAEEIAAAIPNTRLVILSGAAHLANVERAHEVTRLALDHLGEPT